MSDSDDKLDNVWGAEKIADYIGRSVRQTYHLLENGHLPMAMKSGGVWVASKRKLREHFEGAYDVAS